MPTSVPANAVFKAVDLEGRDIECACAGGASTVPPGFVAVAESVMMVALAVRMLAMPP